MKLNSLYVVLLLSIFLISCEGNEVTNRISKFRVINASLVSGDINLEISSQKMYATNIQYLNFSKFSSHISTTHNLKIKDVAGNTLITTSVEMELNKAYSMIVYDSVGVVRHKIIEEIFDASPGSFCKLRFIHTCSNAPAIDIFSSQDTSNLFSNYSIGQHSDYVLLQDDSTRFSIHQHGNATAFFEHPNFIKLKSGSFYTMLMNGQIGATGKDTVGLYLIENNGIYE